jgi:hypothetical protein
MLAQWLVKYLLAASLGAAKELEEYPKEALRSIQKKL